jgi:hypothetical protein
MFSEAYDKCYNKVSFLAAWLLCWPMKLTFICNVVEGKKSLGRGPKSIIINHAITRSFTSSPRIISMIKSRGMRCAGHVARMGAKRNAWRILVGKPEGKRPLGRPRHMCVDNIKMGLLEIRWGGMDWIDLAQDRDQWKALVNMIMSLQVP